MDFKIGPLRFFSKAKENHDHRFTVGNKLIQEN